MKKAFDKFASLVARWTGSPYAFSMALSAIIVWALCGPVFGFSDTWQLVINTSTTIITFLMVFLIQHQQNKDMVEMKRMLVELVRAIPNADETLADKICAELNKQQD